MLAPKPCIKNGLKQLVSRAPVQAVYEFARDELDLFDRMLLDPLRHLDFCEFISAFGSDERSLAGEAAENHAQLNIPPSFLSISDSSSRALQSLKGMQVHVRELCAAWSEQVTSCFNLSRIEWFREKSGARHEYLIANIKNESSASHGNGLWLRLERRPKLDDDLHHRRHRVTRLFGHFEAEDIVTISRRRDHLLHRDDMEAELQAAMVFEQKVSLRYILEVLKIIHEESHSYHILGANCWFFASTIVEILDEKAHATWERRSLDWCDHWKSKNYINWAQYQAISKRTKSLDII